MMIVVRRSKILESSSMVGMFTPAPETREY
jgi:hypothetical protein